MGLIQLCEQFFNTTNLYEVLQINEKASDTEVKKAYHKLSLKVHPDRVEEDKKKEATEKFKVLGAVHAILSDKNKRASYDETKCVEEEDIPFTDRDWSVYWRLLFKKITEEDIIAYEKEYIGSQEEKDDLKHAYLSGKGDMDYIVDQVQFARTEHEPRLRGILTEMIEKGEIPAYKVFTQEPSKKRQKRIAKENREAKEAEELKSKLGLDTENSLEVMIKQKQQSRALQMDSFIDDLAAKYGGNKSKVNKRKTTSEMKGSKTKRRKN